MGFLNVKAVDASAHDVAKTVRKVVYDGNIKCAREKLIESFPQTIKPNGGIDISKLTDEFVKIGVSEDFLNNNGKLTDTGLQIAHSGLKKIGLKTTATIKELLTACKIRF